MDCDKISADFSDFRLFFALWLAGNLSQMSFQHYPFFNFTVCSKSFQQSNSKNVENFEFSTSFQHFLKLISQYVENLLKTQTNLETTEKIEGIQSWKSPRFFTY